MPAGITNVFRQSVFTIDLQSDRRKEAHIADFDVNVVVGVMVISGVLGIRVIISRVLGVVDGGGGDGGDGGVGGVDGGDGGDGGVDGGDGGDGGVDGGDGGDVVVQTE